MIVDLKSGENGNMHAFRNAWEKQFLNNNPEYREIDLSCWDCAKIWLSDYNVIMHVSDDYDEFDKAEFNSDAEYTAFLMKWS